VKSVIVPRIFSQIKYERAYRESWPMNENYSDNRIESIVASLKGVLKSVVADKYNIEVDEKVVYIYVPAATKKSMDLIAHYEKQRTLQALQRTNADKVTFRKVVDRLCRSIGSASPSTSKLYKRGSV
jgi:hypothetical protein